MATSSIFKNFVIEGEEQVEKFLRAIDESEAAQRANPPRRALGMELTDPNELRVLMDRWEERFGVNGHD